MSPARSILTSATFSLILSTVLLSGQLVVFTGKLSSLGRKDARALVTRLGGSATDDVNAKTTMLVIGAEGFGGDPDHDKSNKLKRAEEFNAERAGAGDRPSIEI